MAYLFRKPRENLVMGEKCHLATLFPSFRGGGGGIGSLQHPRKVKEDLDQGIRNPSIELTKGNGRTRHVGNKGW